MAHLDGAFDHLGRYALATYREVHVDAGEHLGVGVSALASELDGAALHGMTTTLQDQHHVISCAAASTRQHQLHRASGKVLTALIGLGGVWRPVHGHHMAAAGLGNKAHCRACAARACPTDCAFHGYSFVFSIVGQR